MKGTFLEMLKQCSFYLWEIESKALEGAQFLHGTVFAFSLCAKSS